MSSLSLILLLLIDRSTLGLGQSGPEPLQIPTSSNIYGPDGPWQAVSVQLGDPPQSLDLYPGGLFQSAIFTNQLCYGTHNLPCGSGGLFDPESSKTLDNQSIGFGRGVSGVFSVWTNGAMMFSYENSTSILERLQVVGTTVANFSAIMYPNITIMYPDGNYSLQVGELALGPAINQSFLGADGIPSVNASLIPGDLAVQNVIPSSSFGLHVGIGAKALSLSLSLWLGGYDASRIVGPVSSQSTHSYQFTIDLLDIGIGVDHGGSPFSYSSQQGLLSYGNSSISSAGISVLMNPGAPYLYLPNSTCAAIAKNLPVTYNIGKALYFWNIADPDYAKIVTSPTYLSFVFRGSSGNLTIKIPFQLLNLTLQAPLVSTNTPYFPCQPPQGSEGRYSLGRAFLQAAFIGVNWAITGESEWFLAQAPGPNTDITPQSRPFTGAPPVGLGGAWADTWRGFWTDLPNPILAPTTASQTNSAAPVPSPATKSSATNTKSLSGGAIAGIVIGSVCAGSIVLGIGVCLRRRRDGKLDTAQSTTVETEDTRNISSTLLPPYRGTRSETVWSETVGSPNLNEPNDETSIDNQKSVAELP